MSWILFSTGIVSKAAKIYIATKLLPANLITFDLIQELLQEYKHYKIEKKFLSHKKKKNDTTNKSISKNNNTGTQITTIIWGTITSWTL